VWLRTTDFGDDKDRVIVRSAQFGGQPTYFCSDLAYYIDKRKRGADKVVILLGADHTATSAGCAAWSPAWAKTR